MEAARPEEEGKNNRLFAGIGRAVVLLVLLFAVLEAVTRVVNLLAQGIPLDAADEYSTLYEEHPYLYRVPIPNAHFGVYDVNSHGFRGHEFAVPKPAHVFRILTLGDSSTWDSNVSNGDATWSAQLERLLNEGRPADGPRFEVVNGGVPGYTSAESVMNFIWRGLAIEPDAVIVYQAYTDFKPNRFGQFKSDYSHFRGRDRTLLHQFCEKSRFLYWLSIGFTRLQPDTSTRYDDVLEPGLAAYHDNLRRIVVLARDAGVQPVLTTFAMPLTPDNERLHGNKFGAMLRNLPSLSFAGVVAAHRRYNEVVVRLGSELDVPVLDADSVMPKDFRHFTDHCHLTDEGSLLFAQFLRSQLLRMLTLPPALRTP